jgi:poly(beta-D-mannuronate) lyase
MQVSATIVEENLFEECDGEIECISNKSCENVYRWNTFRRVQGSLTLRHGNRCRVEGNFFLGEERARTAGIRIIGEDHAVFNNYLEGITGTEARAALAMQNGIVDSPLEGYFQVQRALVVHNTVFRCQQSMAFGTGGDPLRPRDCTLANNVLQGFGPERLEWSDPWLGGNLITRDDQELRFVRGGDGVWRPAGEDSPVHRKAVDGFGWVFEDIEGRPRVTPSELGCFSLYGERTRAPLERGDVGPEWMARP